MKFDACEWRDESNRFVLSPRQGDELLDLWDEKQKVGKQFVATVEGFDAAVARAEKILASESPQGTNANVEIHEKKPA